VWRFDFVLERVVLFVNVDDGVFLGMCLTGFCEGWILLDGLLFLV
jgi:hypothetical protein